MKLLEIEAIEYTTPTIEPDHGWRPITVKVKYTDKNNGIVGRQLAKQITVFEDMDQFTLSSDEWLAQQHLSYKFTIDSDNWLLEGCWIKGVNYFTYDKDSYTEVIIRFDNATEKQC